MPTKIQIGLRTYQDVFSTPSGLPPEWQYDHAISLVPDALPVNTRPYRYSPAHKDEFERQVKEMLGARIIVHNMSPFASPVLLVQKKDGSWRFYVDYRRLNELIVKNLFPMPIIYELSRAKIFSKLDLRARYHQIRMLPIDEHKTAFKTHQGHYHFKVMPFGLCNAPPTFQCVINEALSPCLRKSVLVFMDDILVYGPFVATYTQHLSEVLQLLRNNQLFVKESKCAFSCTSLEYLGHIISVEGVATDPKKTDAMLNWPLPTTIIELTWDSLGIRGILASIMQSLPNL
jgi:hypothetical protein